MSPTDSAIWLLFLALLAGIITKLEAWSWVALAALLWVLGWLGP
jgi:hypothetical protein